MGAGTPGVASHEKAAGNCPHSKTLSRRNKPHSRGDPSTRTPKLSCVRDGEAGFHPGSARVSRAGCGVPPQRTSGVARGTIPCRKPRAKFAEAGRLRYPEAERLRRAQLRRSGSMEGARWALIAPTPAACHLNPRGTRRCSSGSRPSGRRRPSRLPGRCASRVR